MVSTNRHAPDPVGLIEALRERPECFEFFEAVRRLECAFAANPRVGRSTKAKDDPVRFRQTPSLAFAPRSIERFEPSSGGEPASLHGLFFGLFGPNGPLPLHLTQYAMDRQINAQDNTFAAFADIFHHRLMGLFYRAWADAQPTIEADRPEEDRFALYVGALIGLAGEHLAERDAIPDQLKRFFAGRLVAQSRSAEGLCDLLAEYFRVPFAVEPFKFGWMRLPPSTHLRLGISQETASLGRSTIIGEFVPGAQGRFRLRVGPLDRDEFINFLPGNECLTQLAAAVRFYTGGELYWDVQLIVRGDEIPHAQLGRTGKLGLSTWLPASSHRDEVDDLVIIVPEAG